MPHLRSQIEKVSCYQYLNYHRNLSLCPRKKFVLSIRIMSTSKNGIQSISIIRSSSILLSRKVFLKFTQTTKRLSLLRVIMLEFLKSEIKLETNFMISSFQPLSHPEKTLVILTSIPSWRTLKCKNHFKDL